MTLKIPHSVDALVVAVEALIEGRPIPEHWSQPETEPVAASEAAASASPAKAFDEALLMEAISELIDQKLAAMPKPDAAPALVSPTDLYELEQRVSRLVDEKAKPQPLAPADLIVLEQKIVEQISSHNVVAPDDDLRARVMAIENNFAILKQTLGVA